MRVFVGLPISEKLQEKILEWEKGFRDLPVRWLEGKNLHLTLVPPFYANEQELENAKNILKEVEGSGSFEIYFSRATFGPQPRRPRLIWAEGEVPQNLFDLQQKIFGILERTPEKRPLKLHLTMARFRPETFSSFPIKELDEKVDWRDKIERVALFESRLSRDGADYKILEQWLL